jgi:outer membrane protein assembly factor BamD (BamD/ComL family)
MLLRHRALQAAVTAFKNMIDDYPSGFREEAAFMMFKAEYEYASIAWKSKKQERWEQALILPAVNQNYPKANLNDEATSLADNLKKKLNQAEQQIPYIDK